LLAANPSTLLIRGLLGFGVTVRLEMEVASVALAAVLGALLANSSLVKAVTAAVEVTISKKPLNIFSRSSLHKIGYNLFDPCCNFLNILSQLN
jgi:hypothetical protein